MLGNILLLPYAIQAPTLDTALIKCPPCLEYLCHVDQLLVHQQVEFIESLSYLNYFTVYLN